MFEAPLLLLIRAIDFNTTQGQDGTNLRQLYIAQSQLPDLPPALQEDVTTPRLVLESGKGDVYDSSVWMGLEPTNTPLHRDPNPNLFCQIHSGKTVRLLPPTPGDRLYRQVQTLLRRPGNGRIRGVEMMEGPERTLVEDIVWGKNVHADLLEAHLEAGDALFIPEGWWHSVKSHHLDGRLNVSINWWFR